MQQSSPDRDVIDRARYDAALLYERLGEDSLRAVSSQSWDGSKTKEQRRYARLLRLEMEKLVRKGRRPAMQNRLVLWKPRLFSWAWFARYLGRR